jgi:hypothetical protein
VVRFLEALCGQSLVATREGISDGPAPDDRKFVEVALAVPNAVIVTGNLRDFPERIQRGVRGATPVQARAKIKA